MRAFLATLWTITRALVLGLIGQPEGEATRQERQVNAGQHEQAARPQQAGTVETLRTLLREVIMAAAGQPSGGRSGLASPQPDRKNRGRPR